MNRIRPPALTPEVRDDHASYIASWLKVLKDDQRAVFTAASHAQKAAYFLNGLQKPHQANEKAAWARGRHDRNRPPLYAARPISLQGRRQRQICAQLDGLP